MLMPTPSANRTEILVAALVLLSLAAWVAPAQAALVGVVATGNDCLLSGTGCTDAGKLIRLSANGTVLAEIGDTGITDLVALTFDPLSGLLVAGTAGGILYTVDPNTAVATEIVDRLRNDP